MARLFLLVLDELYSTNNHSEGTSVVLNYLYTYIPPNLLLYFNAATNHTI